MKREKGIEIFRMEKNRNGSERERKIIMKAYIVMKEYKMQKCVLHDTSKKGNVDDYDDDVRMDYSRMEKKN